MSTQNSLGTRLLALMLAVVMVFGMLPTHASAAKPSGGRLETITPGGTVNGTEAVYEGLTMEWVEADPSIGRVAGWWVGIKAIAPKNVNMEKATYKSGDTVKSFRQYKDSPDNASEQYIGLWGLVNEQYLRDANTSDGKIGYAWPFDWDGDGEYEQTFEITIDSASTVLKDAEGNVTFPKAVDPGVVTVISEGGTADGSAVRFENVTLNWVEANSAIGRTEGWWIGIKVTAPENADIENAKYTSGGTVKSFNQYKDSTSAPHYIGLWGLVNQEYLEAAKQTDGEVNYEWTFDWNYDGIFEQKVTIAVDADTVKLLDKDGVQVYPKLGAVTSFSGGTILGSTTSEVTVTIDQTTVYYSPADESIGRTAGWWVGIRVEAPEGMTEEELKSATYKVKNGPNAEFGEAKSFFDNKDSEQEPHNIQLWFPVSPESIEKFRNENRNLTMWYTFDWDNDGVYEQNITFSVVPSEKIVLLAGTYPLTFKVTGTNTHTDAVMFGAGVTYDLKAQLNNADESVRFWIVSGEELVTENDNASIDSTTGVLTLKKPGQVVLKAVRAADAYFEAAEATCTLEIAKAQQTITVDSPVELVYQEAPLNLSDILQIGNVMTATGTVYSISAEDSQYAQIVNGTQLQLLRAGTFTISVYQNSDDYYAASAVVAVTVNVAPAAQEELTLLVDGAETYETTYDDADTRYALSAQGGTGDGAVSFQILGSKSLEGEELAQKAVADINGTNLLVYRSGVVTVQVTKAGDDRYAEATGTYEITIQRGTKEFSVISENVDVYYGTTRYEAKTNLPADVKDQDLTFSIGAVNTVDAGVDPSTGVVSFNSSKTQQGTVEIVVTRNENDKYVACTDSFLITMSYDPSLKEVELIVEGTEGKNGWYTSDVTLRAPSGYELNVVSNALESLYYKSSASYSQEGIHTIEYFLRNIQTNTISGKQTLILKIDKSAPINLNVEFAEPTIVEILFDENYTFFNSNVKAVFTAEDAISGIAKIYGSKDGGQSYEEIVPDADGAYSMPVDPEYRDYVMFKAENEAGLDVDNLTDEAFVDSILVLDTIAPVLTIGCEETEMVESVYYTSNEDFRLNFRVEDDNYDLENAVPTIIVKHNDVETVGTPTWTNDAKTGITSMELKTGEALEEGEYEVALSFTDRSGNEALTQTAKVIVDYTAPQVSLVYGNEDTENGWYPNQREATLKVVEPYFLVNDEDLEIKVEGETADHEILEFPAYAEAIAAAVADGTWGGENGEFTLSLPVFDQEVTYHVMISYTDPAGNPCLFEDFFSIDKTPAIVNVEYAPKDQEPSYEIYYQDGHGINLTVKEKNFDPACFEVDATAVNFEGDVLIEGQSADEYYTAMIRDEDNWESGEDGYVLFVPFEEDASYTFNFNYREQSGLDGKKILIQSEQETEFQGARFVVDTEAAELQDVQFVDATIAAKIIDKVTFGFFPATATVKFIFKDVTSGLDYLDVTYEKSGDAGADQAEGYTMEKIGQITQNGSTFEAVVKLPADEAEQLRGTLTAVAADKAGNKSEASGNGSVLVTDSVSPEVTVSFGGADGIQPIFRDSSNQTVDTFADAAAAYYRGPASAIISVTEANFFEGVKAGEADDEVIHEFTIYASRSEGNGYGYAEVLEYLPKDSVQHVAGVTGVDISWGRVEGTDEHRSSGITFEQDGRYSLMMMYRDFSGNDAEIREEGSSVSATSYTSKAIVVDGTAPVISVEYKDGNGEKLAGQPLGAVKAVITVKEHNFDAAEFALSVAVSNLLNANASIFDYASYAKDPSNWKNNGEVHKLELPLFEVDGEYEIGMSYTDLAGNPGNEVPAEKFIIDDTKPEVSIVFTESVKPVTNYNGRDYFAAVTGAVLTVKEHNFTAAGVELTVTNADVEGKTPNGFDFAAYAKNDQNWTHNGDVHTLNLNFSVDANYTIDVKATDVVGNAWDEYEAYDFAVDTTAPEKLSISYEAYDNTDDGVRYYNDRVKVTIKAYDAVSPMKEFQYSYTTNPGVSGVNKSGSGQVVPTSNGNGTWTAEFFIPKDALNSSNQFNGTVSFNATDYAENKSAEYKDTTVIVVDNISPTASVSFTDPVNTENGTAFYAGSIQGTIVITEANFDKNDVQVSVTRNGAAYPVSVGWGGGSGDRHTGSFTLAEDGDYIVTITYQDKSLNKMATYTSGMMTIDTVDPVVKVSGVQHESANNGETIGLTVEVSDRNIDLGSFDPTLTAVIKKDNGDNSYTLETVEIPLGDPIVTTDAEGNTVYRYTIDNLETDGFYTLTCQAVDKSGRVVSVLVFENADGTTTTVEALHFSVNRSGSVFWITTEHNDKYTGEQYVNQLHNGYVNDQVQIVIHESNVDRVDIGEESTTILTLNDGVDSVVVELDDLADGTGNYKKNSAMGDGGWYESSYILNNEMFDHDGVYSVNIITYDKATNSNINTKSENGIIQFTVDRTNPVISANVISGQSEQTDAYTVEFMITDANLNAESIHVVLNGEEVSVQDLGSNRFSFVVEDGLNQSFEITASDMAGNEAELFKVERFTVSEHWWILWYANPLLFWGSIIGAAAAAVGIFLFFFGKKKKEEEQAQGTPAK